MFKQTKNDCSKKEAQQIIQIVAECNSMLSKIGESEINEQFTILLLGHEYTPFYIGLGYIRVLLTNDVEFEYTLKISNLHVRKIHALLKFFCHQNNIKINIKKSFFEKIGIY